MRCATAFLMLLLSLDWSVTQTTGQRIIVAQSNGSQAVITCNVWAELRELRDMAIEQEGELRNSQSKIEKPEQENADLKEKMRSSVNRVEELKKGNADLLARVIASETKVKALETRMSSNENEVKELRRENAGIFIAPVKGVYFFRFNGWDAHYSHVLRIKLHHNDKIITESYNANDEVHLFFKWKMEMRSTWFSKRAPVFGIIPIIAPLSMDFCFLL